MRNVISKPIDAFVSTRNKLSFKKIERLKNDLRGREPKEPYSELENLTRKKNAFLRSAAAWELALWHADKYTKDDAKQCLYYLGIMRVPVAENQPMRQAVLRAESYRLTEKTAKATELVDNLLDKEPRSDLFLAKANLTNDYPKKVEIINKAFTLLNIKPIGKITDAQLQPYNQLKNIAIKHINKSPLVTVIVPAYNSEDTIATAITSLQNQTWQNLEIIVVDDNSTDGTTNIVEGFAKKDSRIKLIKQSKNQGPYIARNTALQQANGEFVTTNDADDWSHQQKIQWQAEHLIKNSEVLGNTSQQVRADNQLDFYRRGNRGFYIQTNISSFMFRREAVIEKIGFWDSVRFGADSEYIERLQSAQGKDSVVHLENALLSFQRFSSSSLTGNTTSGFDGYYRGDRLIYKKAYEKWHKENSGNIKLDFPLDERPFAVPDKMKTG